MSLPPEDDLRGSAFRGRLNEPEIVSYSQNAEDVRLWRIFGRKPRGFYVDVGAGDPVVHSVTKLFYDAGWSGLNIEPGPLHAALVEARPRDVNLEVAVATREVEADFWVSSPDTGLSGFERVPDELVPEGFSFTHKRVQCARLDALIAEHAPDREIDFLKIDVEGAEREVLSSFDPEKIRPTVILVEAISPLDNRPNHEDWESLLVDHGYTFAAFDGINRFYVPVEREDVINTLAYPMSVLDHFERVDAVSQRVREKHALEHRVNLLAEQNASLERRVNLLAERNSSLAREVASHVSRTEQLETENARLASVGVDAVAQLRAVEQTVSWKVTRPLRSIRRAQLRWVREDQGVTRPRTPRPLAVSAPRRAARDRDLEGAFARRLSQAANVLTATSELAPEFELDRALDALEAALSATTVSDRAKAWICLLAVDGSFPTEPSVDRVARRLRMEGTSAVRTELVTRFDDAVELGRATLAQLDARHDRVVVDVTHTTSSDLHTGIQRVVRETVSRWVDAGLPVDLAHFDFAAGSLRLLSESEYKRLSSWRKHLGRSGATMSARVPVVASADVLVPWRCHFVVPELVAEPERCSAYRVLATASVLESFSIIGYDLIPIVAANTVADGMPGSFADYLSFVKHADRISAISRSSADGFHAFGDMAASEGLQKPDVVAHELPIDAAQLDARALDEARRTLGIGTEALIVVVGSHEPRKNHLAVLEAAERIWTGGGTFELLFIGGSGWKSQDFDELVTSLLAAGRPIVVRKRCTEEELWAAYALARFTVFPSFLEGFGLPVAESLASGTPAITSAHGSMAEIAEGGGCLVIDPRDVDSLESAMFQLLHDDRLLERLRVEATSRRTRTWDDYANELWRFFTQ